MTALWNRAGHYIFALWFLLSIYLSIFSFFPRLISAVADWMSAILAHVVSHWCGLSANLRCRSETCSLNIQDAKKSPKIRRLGTIAQLCRDISSQLRHVSTIGKKLVKQQYLPHVLTIW